MVHSGGWRTSDKAMRRIVRNKRRRVRLRSILLETRLAVSRAGESRAPLLAVCSTRRSDSCPQAARFTEKARSLGMRATVLQENLSHEQINETLGEPSVYMTAVDRFVNDEIGRAHV